MKTKTKSKSVKSSSARSKPNIKHARKKTLTAKRKAKLVVKQARPVHRKLLLHPFTVFVLLCMGVFMAHMTFNASADSFTVSAKVATAPLTTGATINQPTDGDIITQTPINVIGDCPPDSYVVLYRNETMSGVALCSPGNSYSIQTSLYPDSNVLRVQAYNLTDDPGPTTPEITVTYNPPVVTPSNPNPSPTSPTPTSPSKPQAITDISNLPVISSDFKYSAFGVHNTFEWPIDILGGTAPYRIITEWGDNSTSESSVSKPATTTIRHRYKKAGYYKVKVKLTDATGAVSYLQIVAVIKSQSLLTSAGSSIVGSGTTGNSVSSSPLSLITEHWLPIAWGSYTTIAVMMASFWLGERQQLLNLISRGIKTPRHK